MVPVGIAVLKRWVLLDVCVWLVLQFGTNATIQYGPVSHNRMLPFRPWANHVTYLRNEPSFERLVARTPLILKSTSTAGSQTEVNAPGHQMNIFNRIRNNVQPKLMARANIPRETNRYPPRILDQMDPRRMVENRIPESIYQSQWSPSGHGKKLNIWSYDDSVTEKVGPRGWHRAFPNCGHRFQSPIDISPSHFQYRPMAPIILTSLDNGGMSGVVFSNDGFTATIKPLTRTIFIDCDDLPGRFILSGIHFHWGRTDHVGSEHFLEGHSFPLEMHLVAYNSEYSSVQEAEGKENGIHTVAIFFELSDRHNQGLNFCVESLKNIQRPGADYRGDFFNISQLFPPPGLPYYRYLGSLTTPPCAENVVWSIFAIPQVISSHQLARFRSIGMSIEPNQFTGGNVRPLQPLDNRIIFTNDVFFKK